MTDPAQDRAVGLFRHFFSRPYRHHRASDLPTWTTPGPKSK